MIHRRHALVLSAAAISVALGLVAGAQAGPHSNAAAIVIADSATPPTAATLYPSAVSVAAEPMEVTKATVTISGFSHVTSDDVDILFQSPTRMVQVMGDAGGFNTSTNLTITFDQTFANSLPDTGALSSGTFKPTNHPPTPGCAGEGDVFPGAAPGGPYSGNLDALNGESPNGTYNLWVVDDCFGDAGTISGGWTVTLTTGQTTAVTLRSFVAVAHPNSVDLRWHTASEAGVLGFNVYRTSGKQGARINKALIRAKAGPIVDAPYRLVDRSVRPGSAYTYRLQAVKIDGTRAWLGTAGVRTAS